MMQSLSRLFSGLSARLVAVVAAVAGFLMLLFGHKWRVRQAEKRGEEDGAQHERDRVFRETVDHEDEIEEKRDEVRRQHSNLERNELRKRMRDAATRRSSE